MTSSSSSFATTTTKKNAFPDEAIRSKEQKQEQEQEQQHQELLMLKLAQDRVTEAMALFDERRGDWGIGYWRDALWTVEEIRGTFHPETAKLYLGLAGTLVRVSDHHNPEKDSITRHSSSDSKTKQKKKNARKQIREAQQYFQQALQIYQTIPAPERKNRKDYLGEGRYSKGSLQALLGLGTTYTDLEKWHEAMKMFQSAIRLEYFNIAWQGQQEKRKNKKKNNKEDSSAETEENKATPAPKLISVDYLRKHIRNIQTNHPQTNKKVWSHFPSLPKNLNAYLDALQATVRHEVQGDRFYRRGQFEVASKEYEMALLILETQVHSTKKWGVSLDKVWLVRKQSLAEFGADRPLSPEEAEAFPLNRLSPSLLDVEYVVEQEDGRDGYYDTSSSLFDCSTFSRVCETLAYADTLLLLKGNKHEALQEAVHRYQEAKTLTQIYRSVYSFQENSTYDSSKSDKDDVLEILDDLSRQLVPEGQQTQIKWKPKEGGVSASHIWEQLERLTIMVEESSAVASVGSNTILEGSTSSSCPAPAVPPTRKGASSSSFSIHLGQEGDNTIAVVVWLVLIVLQFVILPMFLFRKANASNSKARQNMKQQQQKKKGAAPKKKIAKNNPQNSQTRKKEEVMNETLLPPSSPVATGIGTDSRPASRMSEQPQKEPMIPPSFASEVATNTNTAVQLLQALDRMEETLQAPSLYTTSAGKSGFPGSDDDDDDDSPMVLLANKVSAIVWIKKTRHSILNRLTEEVDDPIPSTNGSSSRIVNVRQSSMQQDVETFLNRMKELGFAPLFSKISSSEDGDDDETKEE